MEDEIEGKEVRMKVSTCWISRGLCKGKRRDQNMATGKAEVGQ